MSIADEIRNMNNTFLSTKTQETLKEMPLEKLAENWLVIDKDAKESSKTADGSLILDSLYQKDKKEAMDKLATVITPEELKNKLDKYLSENTFDAADFHGISSLLDNYSAPSDKDELRNQIESIKNKISTKRLNVEKPVNLNIYKESLGYTSVNIESNIAVIKDLSNPKDEAGKTLTFRDKQGKDIAGIEFDKNGNMDILVPDENGMAQHYRFTKDRIFSKEANETAMVGINLDAMTPEENMAYKFAKEAQNIWKDYADGKLDDTIIRDTPVTINEGAEQEGVKVNEQESEIQIDQGKQKTTKVNEFNPLVNMRDPTKINEGESQKKEPKKEADVNGDDLNQPKRRDDEVYWKEDDIIDTMFMWLVDGANAATNFVVHRIEDIGGAIWAQYHKELMEQKAEKEQTANSTQKLKKELTELHKAKMDQIEKTSDKKNINTLLEQGNIQTILDEHPTFAILYDKYPHIQQMMTPQYLADDKNRKKVTSVISNIITTSESFAQNYALASMMDEKIKDKSAFNTLNKEQQEAEYNNRRQEGAHIFITGFDKYFADNRTNAVQGTAEELTFLKTLEQMTKEVDQAKKTNNKTIKNEQYDEKGQESPSNLALIRLQKFAPQREDPNARTPQTLQDEAESSARSETAQDSRRDDLSQEEAANEADRQRNRERRAEFDRRTNRDNSENNDPQNNNQDSRQGPSPIPRDRDGGR